MGYAPEVLNHSESKPERREHCSGSLEQPFLNTTQSVQSDLTLVQDDTGDNSAANGTWIPDGWGKGKNERESDRLCRVITVHRIELALPRKYRLMTETLFPCNFPIQNVV